MYLVWSLGLVPVLLLNLPVLLLHGSRCYILAPHLVFLAIRVKLYPFHTQPLGSEYYQYHTLQTIASLLGHLAATYPMPPQLKHFLRYPFRSELFLVGRTITSLVLITWSFSLDQCMLAGLLPRLCTLTMLSYLPGHHQPVLCCSWFFAHKPVADQEVVCLVRSNPADPKATLSNNTFQWKQLGVPVILDVRLHYFGSLAYYGYNQVLLSSF